VAAHYPQHQDLHFALRKPGNRCKCLVRKKNTASRVQELLRDPHHNGVKRTWMWSHGLEDAAQYETREISTENDIHEKLIDSFILNL